MLSSGEDVRGFSLLEGLCALALFSFLILATTAVQTRSLEQLNRQAQRWEHYLSLSGWQPDDLSSGACGRHSGSSGKTVIICSRTAGIGRHSIRAGFLLN